MLGATAGPFEAWLVLRGLQTLALRVQRQSANALELARRLSAHPAVERVHYPGLEPADGPATRVLSGGFGAMLSFVLREASPASESQPPVPPVVERFVKALEMVRLVPSLGEVCTTLSHPASTSHRAIPPERRRRLGIVDRLVRLSVGAEAVDDIWQDLERALAQTV